LFNDSQDRPTILEGPRDPEHGAAETMNGCAVTMGLGPSGTRLICAAAVAVFCYGTVLHVVQLATGGWDPYPRLPGWLAAYFVSLAVLDPLAAALLWLRRRAGLALGCAVLVTDAAANGYANYVPDTSPGLTAGRIGQAAITVLALALLAAAPRVWPWLSPNVRSQ
jgi:hypothetical protein